MNKTVVHYTLCADATVANHMPTFASVRNPGVSRSCAREIGIFIAERPAPHPARPERRVALRIVLVTVPHVSRSCEHFPDGFDLHLLCVVPADMHNAVPRAYFAPLSLQIAYCRVTRHIHK